MKLWIIAAIVMGALVIASLGVVSFVKADSQKETAKTTQTPAPSCGANGGCSAGCSHSSSSGQCGCGESCGCSGANGCGCKARQ